MSRKSFLSWLLIISHIFSWVACNSDQSADSSESTSSGTTAAFPTTPLFRGQINEVVQSYLAVKDALVGSDVEQASGKAEELVKNLRNIQPSGLATDTGQKWSEHQKKLIRAAEPLQAAQKLGEKRVYFEDVSEMLYEALKDFGTETVLYKQYCPMAFQDKGAFWLSAQQEIKNPYFGKTMPKCGEVQEVLK